MNNIIRLDLSTFVLATSLLVAGNAPFADEDRHWSYSGTTGPENWAGLSPDFATCGIGLNQSPIDIIETVAVKLDALKFNYQSNSTVIVNNGHTLQIDAGPGSWFSTAGERFQLIQLHLHSPSEHRLDGESFPLEAHFVHQNESGALAVVGVLFRAGEWNAELARLGAEAPKTLNSPVPIDLNFAELELFRDHESYYRYNGSLTTPPCTEGVQWYVLKNPGHIAPAQADSFVAIIGEDARGPQPVNARIVIEN